MTNGEIYNDVKMETVLDIVSDMRTLGQIDEKSTDKIPRSLQALALRTYADRIEKAYRNESHKIYMNGLREGVQDFAFKLSHNIAKCIGEYGIPKEDK